jgi:hypothetical protein
MSTNGNFRYCSGENIEVYTAYGDSPFEAIRNLMKGFRKIEKKTGYAPSIAHISVLFNEELNGYSYDATAYTYGNI